MKRLVKKRVRSNIGLGFPGCHESSEVRLPGEFASSKLSIEKASSGTSAQMLLPRLGELASNKHSGVWRRLASTTESVSASEFL